MANYDPNDPNKTTVRETYVEPVEKRSSPLPLIIGILLALALAYFVLTRFMGSDDTVAVEETAVTAPADVPTLTGSNFSKWFNPAEGTLVVLHRRVPTIAGHTAVAAALGDLLRRHPASALCAITADTGFEKAAKARAVSTAMPRSPRRHRPCCPPGSASCRPRWGRWAMPGWCLPIWSTIAG